MSPFCAPFAQFGIARKRRIIIQKRMTDGIDWSLWRTLAAVVEHGTLSGAARALGLTQPTVGRQIDALEARLGQSLFLRSPRGLQPTDLARNLAAEARQMALAAAHLQRLATKASGGLSGTVRIAASEVVGSFLLPALLGPLLRAHDGLRIELTLSDDHADLVHHEADLAIRMQKPQQNLLIARHLADVRIGLYAHERYLSAAGMPQSPEALAQHVLIGPERGALQALAPLGAGIGPGYLRLLSDHPAAQIRAVLEGVGIGALQSGFASRQPGLQAVLRERVSWQLEAWLVLHPDSRRLAPVRLVADWLARHLPEAFRDTPAGAD